LFFSRSKLTSQSSIRQSSTETPPLNEIPVQRQFIAHRWLQRPARSETPKLLFQPFARIRLSTCARGGNTYTRGQPDLLEGTHRERISVCRRRHRSDLVVPSRPPTDTHTRACDGIGGRNDLSLVLYRASTLSAWNAKNFCPRLGAFRTVPTVLLVERVNRDGCHQRRWAHRRDCVKGAR
jgi:hypothetical protein